ncbi:uncharacterized protein LOC6580453 [Drosophila mojavensis]|uniref:Uncharacterized protein n=1 Tax=Drosophila mojavensis TaxID=7230 RepID=B4KPU9_DROMO|nr:uncharacterized protein LOC6580453 [Drosophila mojavensis]EDW10226.2 uncharacterized protein Dmoj_GI20963 [Drosophila mojavensis]
MKLYVLHISMLALALALCQLQVIGAQESCLDRCLLSWPNEVSNAHEELALEPKSTKLDQQHTNTKQQQQQLAECRQNVQQFDCTLKCMFEHFQVPYRCSNKRT